MTLTFSLRPYRDLVAAEHVSAGSLAYLSHAGRVIMPPRNRLPILLEDPFIEEIRLRTRWLWQDEMAKIFAEF